VLAIGGLISLVAGRRDGERDLSTRHATMKPIGPQ
jgi:hypothetical protein